MSQWWSFGAAYADSMSPLRRWACRAPYSAIKRLICRLVHRSQNSSVCDFLSKTCAWVEFNSDEDKNGFNLTWIAILTKNFFCPLGQEGNFTLNCTVETRYRKNQRFRNGSQERNARWNTIIAVYYPSAVGTEVQSLMLEVCIDMLNEAEVITAWSAPFKINRRIEHFARGLQHKVR